MSAADVIGIISSVSHAAHKLYKFVQSYKGASAGMQALQIEVCQVHGLLEQIQQVTTEGQPEPNMSLDALRYQPNFILQAQQLVKAADAFVAKATIKQDASAVVSGSRKGNWRSGVSRMKKAVAKVKWTFKESEVKELTAKFQAFYGAISAVYSVNVS